MEGRAAPHSGAARASLTRLLDGNFIFHAIKFKVDIRLRVEKLLQEPGVKLYVLRSVIAELEAVGSNAASSLQIL